MATSIKDTINALSLPCTDDELRALHRACAWNAPDFEDLKAALKFGQPSVLAQLFLHSKMPISSRPELASWALLTMSESPLDYARPDRLADVLISAGANVNAKTHQGICALGSFARQLGSIEAEEDHNASHLKVHTTGAGSKLRRLWEVVVIAGADATPAHEARMSSYHQKSTLLTNLQKRREASRLQAAPFEQQLQAARM